MLEARKNCAAGFCNKRAVRGECYRSIFLSGLRLAGSRMPRTSWAR